MSVKYSEEFKHNAVRACMEEGITRTEVARRLGIQYKTLKSWLDNSTYDIDSDVIETKATALVQIGNTGSSDFQSGKIRITNGDICIEFATGATAEELRTVLTALKA